MDRTSLLPAVDDSERPATTTSNACTTTSSRSGVTSAGRCGSIVQPHSVSVMIGWTFTAFDIERLDVHTPNVQPMCVPHAASAGRYTVLSSSRCRMRNAHRLDDVKKTVNFYPSSSRTKKMRFTKIEASSRSICFLKMNGWTLFLPFAFVLY